MEVLKSIETSLENYKGKALFFEPLGGNHGDKLIEKGSLHYFEAHGLKLVDNPANAEAIVINGGGAMNDIWKSGLSALKKYITRYPTIPLIILPSSFIFNETDFAMLLLSHEAPVTIYAREHYSLKLLQELSLPNNIKLGLDKDMAFHLSKSSLVKDLKEKSKNKHILIVERQDSESPFGRNSHSSSNLQTPKRNKFVSYFRDSVSHNLVTPLRHRLQPKRGKMGVGTDFFVEAYERCLQEHPELAHLPVYAADISNTKYFNFNQFNRLVSQAAIITTTRLHVAILAAMLNKPTYVKSGSYHKIRGVYEYSLKNITGFHLID